MARYTRQITDLIRMSDKRTPSVLPASRRQQLTPFLCCEIEEADGLMPVTALSLFSRMKMEPWDEAQALTMMPEHAAADRLAWVIFSATISYTQAEARLVAKSLLTLLPEKIAARRPTAGQVAAIRHHTIVLTSVFMFTGLVLLQKHQPPPAVQTSPRATIAQHDPEKHKTLGMAPTPTR